MQRERGDGETSRQMMAAPKGSVFVWCNNRSDYAKALAKHLGREDLSVQRLEWLNGDAWRGRTLPGLVIDHAAQLTEEQANIARRIRVA
jgi:hypothetical protein